MSYLGQVLNPEWGEDYFQGMVRCHARGIQIECTEGDLLLPYSELVVDPFNGHENQVYFSHPAFPGAWIVVETPQILNEPAILERPSIKRQIRGFKIQSPENADSKNKNPSAAFSSLKWVGIFFGVIAVISLGVQLLLTGVIGIISPSLEVEIGKISLENFLESHSATPFESRERDYVETITKNIYSTLPEQTYQYKITFVEDKTPNAFALPGGFIVVTSGLLKFVGEDVNKLAGVLAHEISHVEKRHGLRTLVNTTGPTLIIQSIIGNDAGIISLVTKSSLMLSGMSYSRKMEFEADEMAVDLLIGAGYDPIGLKAFLLQLNFLSGDGVPEFLSTHPATDARIKRLNQKMMRAD